MPLELKKTTQEVLEYLISGLRVTPKDDQVEDASKAHRDEARLHAKPPDHDRDPLEPR